MRRDGCTNSAGRDETENRGGRVKPECRTCRYFSRNSADEFDDSGECRISPPVIVPKMIPTEDIGGRAYGYWPTVMEDYWCGKHEPE